MTHWATVDQVLLLEEFQTDAHRVIALGRGHQGTRYYLDGTTGWQPITEGGAYSEGGGVMGDRPPGIYLPHGVLDAIVTQHHRTTAPQPATERHLEDAIATRDRLLTLVEKRR